jgi:hypothetical protein
VVFDRGTRKFLGLFNERFHRRDDTIDSDTCKVHCCLHIQNTLMSGDPMQWDAAKGERGLKDWAKHRHFPCPDNEQSVNAAAHAKGLAGRALAEAQRADKQTRQQQRSCLTCRR